MKRRERPDRPAEPVDDLFCVQCGAPLSGDRDEDPNGAGRGRPVCGECSRAREFDLEQEVAWHEGRW